MRAAMQSAGLALRDALYPATCLLCHDPVAEPGLCGPCRRDAPFVTGATCPTCAVPLPGPAGDGERCDVCRTSPPPWDEARAALLYDGPARRLILRLKHGDRTELARPAAAWLSARARDLLRGDTLVVPVPLHRFRLWRRRYNQSAEVARALAGRMGLLYAPEALRRTRRTLPQDHRSKPDRRANVAGAFAASGVEGRHVAVVDDVMASGATMAACADALRMAGAARITALALARVP